MVVIEKEYENTEVDEQLILLAKEMKGNIVTNDFNLNKVATVKGAEGTEYQRVGQLVEAGSYAWRGYAFADRQRRQGAGTGRSVPGRWHDGRSGQRRIAHREHHLGVCYLRAANGSGAYGDLAKAN